MPINDLLAIVYITWASLTVHLGVDLPRAERLLHGAKRRLNRRRRCERPSMTDAPFSDERDMRCRFHEARALLLLAHRDVSGCIRECEISLAGAPRSGAWLLLARALLLGVHDSVLDDAPALDRTRAALNRAREADLRGVFTQDLVEIESHLAAARATSTRP